MGSTNFTTHYSIPLPLGTDLTTPMDYNESMTDVDTALFGAVTDASNASEAAAEAVSAAAAAGDAAADVASDLAIEKAKIVALQTRMTSAENEIDDVRADGEDAICAYNEPTATSTHAYAIGDYFFYNDTLYKATAAINIGATIVPDTNCTTTNITSELIQINDNLSKNSVSVTGDGVKTYSQLLNELFTLVDTSKINANSVLEVGVTGATSLYHPISIRSSLVSYGLPSVDSSNGARNNQIIMKASDSTYFSAVGSTVTDLSAEVLASGSIIKATFS